MVARILSCLLLLLLTGSALAQDSYEGGRNYWKPRPYKVTAVKSVVILQNGAWSENISSDETAEICSKFVLSQSDVREFFRRARRVSYKEYSHDLDMSRCHATGKVVFANGDRGEWSVDRERRGLLTLSDGRNVYFYCRNCGAKAFGEP
jgi:hypothetical protein